jgi:hypothetical protein
MQRLPPVARGSLRALRQTGEITTGGLKMSSSNLAVRMDDTATDLLSLPPRTAPGSASAGRPDRQTRRRTSFTNRKFVNRDHGLRLFRVR